MRQYEALGVLEMGHSKNYLPLDGELKLHPEFFSTVDSARYFSLLLSEIEWKHEPIMIFGKKVMQPRLTAWYGEKNYRYSGTTLMPLPWNRFLLEIKNRVEKKCAHHFNSVLLNYYRDGDDHMGWHRDNEKELGENPFIASISFGAPRPFLVKHKKFPEHKVSIDLVDGSLLTMGGDMQSYWYHSLPKRRLIKEPRINLTFRSIL